MYTFAIRKAKVWYNEIKESNLFCGFIWTSNLTFKDNLKNPSPEKVNATIITGQSYRIKDKIKPLQTEDS